MEYLVDAKKMKQCDQAAIEELGIPSLVLMERAALAVTEEILKARPQPAPVLVVCGSGNNGVTVLQSQDCWQSRRLPLRYFLQEKMRQ